MSDSSTNSNHSNGDGAATERIARPEHHEDVIPKDLQHAKTSTIILASIAFACVLVALFLIGYIPQRAREAKLREEASQVQDAKPVVTVAPAKRQSQSTDLVLPGDVRAMQQTSLFPRTNGYIKLLLVDIGDRVEANQLLAVIDAPEVEAQLAQARAAVKQSEANINRAQTDLSLGKTTLDHYEGFAKSGGVTLQQLDEKRNQYTETQASLEAAQASLAASTADVQRLEAMVSFAKIVAPFAGTITTRGYDLGARVSSTDAGPGHEIFQIAQVDTLRVFVNVPQAYVRLVKVGQQAELEVGNYTGRKFTGNITRSAGAIDPTTRTQRYEVDFPNKDNVLTAGMYGQVRFHLFQEQPPLIVPSSALVYDAQGMRVATIKDGKAHFHNVEVGRDFGTEMEVQNGLQLGELVVANPGERLAEGVEVEVAEQPGQNAPPNAAPVQNKTAVTEADGTRGNRP